MQLFIATYNFKLFKKQGSDKFPTFTIVLYSIK